MSAVRVVSDTRPVGERLPPDVYPRPPRGPRPYDTTNAVRRPPVRQARRVNPGRVATDAQHVVRRCSRETGDVRNAME